MLHVVDGLTVHEITRVINRSEFETIRNLEQTRSVMHDCLGGPFPSRTKASQADRGAYNVQVPETVRQNLNGVITAWNERGPTAFASYRQSGIARKGPEERP